MKPTARILSLGAGVQSTTLALMIARGELPMVDAAIFADTGWEPQEVYHHLWWLAGELTKADIPVYIAVKGNILEDAFVSSTERWATMPLYVRTEGKKTEGRIWRQCTKEYKLEPIEETIRQKVLGLKPRARMPRGTRIELVIGISADEAQRMRQAKKRWQTNVYPLCDAPVGSGRVMRRDNCRAWLERYYSGRVVVKSACIGCPFHNDKGWRDLKIKAWKTGEFGDWQDVIKLDLAIRDSPKMRGAMYLHASCRPIDEVDLTNVSDHGQVDLFGEECEGMCGV